MFYDPVVLLGDLERTQSGPAQFSERKKVNSDAEAVTFRGGRGAALPCQARGAHCPTSGLVMLADTSPEGLEGVESHGKAAAVPGEEQTLDD